MKLYDLSLSQYLWIILEGYGKGLNTAQTLRVMKAMGAKIARDTMLKINKELREAVYDHMMLFPETIKMGGPNANVQVDESMVNHDSRDLREGTQKNLHT